MIKKICLSILAVALTIPIFALEKKPAIAVGLSALLPGAGCLYTGNNHRAKLYLASEALIWFSYFHLDNAADLKGKSNRLFAGNYADAPLNQDDLYYSNIAKYDSSDEFNLEVERYARNRYVIYENNPTEYENYIETYSVPEELEWDWQNLEKRIAFKQKRREEQETESYSKLVLSCLAINRIISMIDAARLARRHNRLFNSKTTSLYVSPDLAKKGLQLNYELRF